jgi:hypothetical protein
VRRSSLIIVSVPNVIAQAAAPRNARSPDNPTGGSATGQALLPIVRSVAVDPELHGQEVVLSLPSVESEGLVPREEHERYEDNR